MAMKGMGLPTHHHVDRVRQRIKARRTFVTKVREKAEPHIDAYSPPDDCRGSLSETSPSFARFTQNLFELWAQATGLSVEEIQDILNGDFDPVVAVLADNPSADLVSESYCKAVRTAWQASKDFLNLLQDPSQRSTSLDVRRAHRLSMTRANKAWRGALAAMMTKPCREMGALNQKIAGTNRKVKFFTDKIEEDRKRLIKIDLALNDRLPISEQGDLAGCARPYLLELKTKVQNRIEDFEEIVRANRELEPKLKEELAELKGRYRVWDQQLAAVDRLFPKHARECTKRQGMFVLSGGISAAIPKVAGAGGGFVVKGYGEHRTGAFRLDGDAGFGGKINAGLMAYSRGNNLKAGKASGASVGFVFGDLRVGDDPSLGPAGAGATIGVIGRGSLKLSYDDEKKVGGVGGLAIYPGIHLGIFEIGLMLGFYLGHRRLYRFSKAAEPFVQKLKRIERGAYKLIVDKSWTLRVKLGSYCQKIAGHFVPKTSSSIAIVDRIGHR